MRGAPPSPPAPLLGAAPECVARLSPGRGTLCVTSRGPAPLCLRFCPSGRASVILSVPVAWLSLLFCVCSIGVSRVRAQSVCLSVITGSVCILSARCLARSLLSTPSCKRWTLPLQPEPGREWGLGMKSPHPTRLERGWCRLSLTTWAKLWIREDPEIEGGTHLVACVGD